MIDIASTSINEGRFVAEWVGNDPNANAGSRRDDPRGFRGNVLGELYGPAGEEIGGVISGRARRDGQHAPNNSSSAGSTARNPGLQ